MPFPPIAAVQGPHRQASVVGLVAGDVGDRLVGIASPRVQGPDQLIDRGAGQELGGRLTLRLADLVAGSARGVVEDDHRVNEGARPVLQEAVGQGCHGCAQPGPGLVQVRGVDRQVRAQGSGHAADPGHRDVRGRLGAYAVGQLVRLINHDGVVFTKKFALAAGVDTEQGVVGDHDVSLGGVQARGLGEALVDEGAMLAQALGLGDRGMVPCAVGDARHQVVAIPRRGLGDPLADAQDLLAELTRRSDADVTILEERALGRVAAVQLVQARVVRPPLEHRDLQAHARL